MYGTARVEQFEKDSGCEYRQPPCLLAITAKAKRKKFQDMRCCVPMNKNKREY
jgi:hypothetical protein